MDMSKMETLGGLIDEIDAEGPPTEQQQQEQAVEEAGEQAAREWGSIVFMVGNAMSMLAPELRTIYTEEACFNWGRAMNPVAEKYGWNGPSNVPELGLLIATAGLAVPSWFIVRAKLTEVREGKAKEGGWLSSLGAWWRGRKAAREQAAAEAAKPAPIEQGATHGG